MRECCFLGYKSCYEIVVSGGEVACFALTIVGYIYPTTIYTETPSGFTTMSVFEAYAEEKQ